MYIITLDKRLTIKSVVYIVKFRPLVVDDDINNSLVVGRLHIYREGRAIVSATNRRFRRRDVRHVKRPT